MGLQLLCGSRLTLPANLLVVLAGTQLMTVDVSLWNNSKLMHFGYFDLAI